jgi:hypothetical protein
VGSFEIFIPRALSLAFLSLGALANVRGFWVQFRSNALEAAEESDD